MPWRRMRAAIAVTLPWPALQRAAPPVENKGNIDLVTKYCDKLADAMGNDQQ